MDKIAANAQMARTRAGFDTHKAAAKKIGCARTLVLAWEAGTAALKGSKYLLDAAKAYKVRPEWLAKDEGEDGYPWSESGESVTITEPDPPLDMRIEALDTVLTAFAHVLAATIPTLGRALEDRVAGLPDDLLAQRFGATLLNTLRQQNIENDLAAAKAKKRSRS